MLEEPKTSVGAKCSTSSGSNGGCRVVLVIFLFNIFLRKIFFLIRNQKSARDLCLKIFVTLVGKKTRLTPEKKVHAIYAKKKHAIYAFFHNGPPLSFRGRGEGICTLSTLVQSCLGMVLP